MIRIYGGTIEEDIKIFICKAVNGGHCRSEWRYVRRFVLSTMLAGVAVYGACLLYRINYIAALFVMILAVIMIPGLVRNYFMERSKASRFADVDVYLHQMTYSFIRNPKVNIALQDAYAISSGRLKRCLSRAIEELQYGMGERVYEDALKIVEEEYDCSRIRTLHKFLVSVEEKSASGGF